MPTGYTAGILDGQITTFEQFAKQCARNFGATIHMRDESFDKPYEERKPSTYNSEALVKAKKLLRDSKELPDADLIERKRLELLIDKEYHLKKREEAKVNAMKMNDFLEKAKKYVAPTPEHAGIRDFMIQQLSDTIRHDCDWSDGYHAKKLIEIDEELKNLSAKGIRDSMAAEAYKDILYHQKEYDLELKRCEDSNKWVETFFKSIQS